MHQIMILLVLQRLQYLYSESAYQVLRYAFEIVVFDEFVEVD